MAVIDIHISAEGVEDYFNTLRGLLRGDEKVTDLKVQSALAPRPKSAAEPDAVKGVEIGTSDDNEGTPDEETVLDAHGHPWSADLHASTKAMTKEGIWRMKPGATRPAPMPGYPKEGTAPETSNTGVIENGTIENVQKPVSETSGTAETWTDGTDEDEFAAFKTDETPSVPEREWTDADMSKLCNQAATKMGGPDGVKNLISVYTAAGKPAHSRNIPVEDRERFAQEVEALAGITYEG